MTRKDYWLIANALRDSRQGITGPGAPNGAPKTADDMFYAALCNLATALESDNPRFDRRRFAAAAEGAKA